MKKVLFSIFGLAFMLQAKAQFTYDFGTATQSSAAPAYGGSGSTADQWPLGTSGAPYLPTSSQGTVGIVSRGDGTIQLVNSPVTGLSGSYLSFLGNTTTATNQKFGIYNITNTGNIVTVKFKVHVPTSSVGGSYVLALGNGSNFVGAGVGTNVAQGFTFLRIAITASAVTLSHYVGASSSYVGNDYLSGTANTIAKGATHEITIFANNATSATAYTANGTNNLAVGTWDVWVDGVKVFAGCATAGLGTGVDLDDVNFLNSIANSSGTASYLYFDDLYYAPSLTPSVLPVTLLQPLSAKVTGSNVQLNWGTATEQNSNHFDILHAANGKDFTKIGERATQSVNGAAYTFTHFNAPVGDNYYKLAQIDNNGATQEFAPVAVKVGLTSAELKATTTTDGISAIISGAKAGDAQIAVYDMTGRLIIGKSVKLQEGNNTIALLANLAEGVYVVRVDGAVKLAKKVVKN